jgi:hypothetical protein
MNWDPLPLIRTTPRRKAVARSFPTTMPVITRRSDPPARKSALPQSESFVSVYVHPAARAYAVRAAVARLRRPDSVTRITVDDKAITEIFGCRIAVDITGTFDERDEGPGIARGVARDLTSLLGLPSHALIDLISPKYFMPY